MEEITTQDVRCNAKNEKDDKILYNNYRTNCGLCCVCHTPPSHSRTYYGHIFCTDCFYKYIFSPSKTDCSGDITKLEIQKEDPED
ncbi:hypothetical protein B5X24_HaOG205937 [Helicoverpa armigera]|uniref:Uncharacterized protein n=1 Tax=Helicoverpa armigera TaxID=29058 RepID=A0A2W1BL08_HELAM|nr:hypothetical protein B5X24_HaOG205937 [Helicoverpa armigera]